MIKGFDIIYFGPEKWEGIWRNRHQLMSRFAKFNKVLYVEPTIAFKKFLAAWSQEKFKPDIIRAALKTPRLTKIDRNLYVCHHNPLLVPVIGKFLLSGFTRYLREISLKSAIHKLRFKNPIIWLSKPNMIEYVGKFDEQLLIYHVVDDYLTYQGITDENRHILNQLEMNTLKGADLVIVVSNNLLIKKKPINKNTYLVPNATDYEAYTEIREGDTDLPDDMSKLDRPILGYSGLISPRLNLDLLLYLAQAKPEWSIVLIGQYNTPKDINNFANLLKLPNVYYLGRKHASEMPSYIKAIDVGIIPYKKNEHAQNISPLKLYDYLAMGKPIVTTDFAAAHEFSDLVRISDNKEEFVANIQQVLEIDNKELFNRRINCAAENTWDVRVDQISDLIHTHLSQKSFSQLSSN